MINKLNEEDLEINKYKEINSLINYTKFPLLKFNSKSSFIFELLVLLKNILFIRYLIKFTILILFSIYIINLLYFEFLCFVKEINNEESEIIKINNSEKYLNIKKINQFNNYIKICHNGILENKKKYH